MSLIYYLHLLKEDYMDRRKKFLLFDLVFWSILAIFSEVINMKVLNIYYSGFYFSISMLIVFIAIFRWGAIGAITAFVVSITSTVVLKDADISSYAVNIIGSVGIFASYLVLKKMTRETVLQSGFASFLYIISGYATIVVIRSVILTILGANFINAIVLIFSNELLSIFAVTILFILFRKQTKLVNDMNKVFDESEEARELDI